MRQLLLALLALLVFILACGGTLRQRATITATAVHDAVAIAMPMWGIYVEEQVAKCQAERQPDWTLDDADKCLGPALHAKEVRESVEVLTTVQLGLFVALSEDKADAEVKQALADLRTRFGQLARYWRDAGVCRGVCAQVVDSLWTAPPKLEGK